jgi:membrane-associated phospholipid phosphatase
LKAQFSLKANDGIVFLYLFISGLFIIFHRSQIPNFPQLIISRGIGFFIILILSREFDNQILRFLRYFYPFAFTTYFYGETGLFNQVLFPLFDSLLIRADEWIFGFQPALMFSHVFPQCWFSELMYFSYFSFYLFIFGFALYSYFHKTINFEAVTFQILFSLYFLYTMFWIFPSVGPQFFYPPDFASMPDSGWFSSLQKWVQHIGETPTGAFPSSHIAISWIILSLLWQHSKTAACFVFPFVFLLTLSTVYIKAHYVVDVIGGFVFVPILLRISYLLYYKIKPALITNYHLWKFK